MREREYSPLLANGFKDITETDLHKEFVSPFDYPVVDHRNNLLIDFNSFLNEFKSLKITAEVWIDGSFVTEAPDPSDIDVVFYFRPAEIDDLDMEKKDKFNRLFTNRRFIRNLYNVEVHYANRDNVKDYQQWQKTFGTYYDDITPKGIFRMIYK